MMRWCKPAKVELKGEPDLFPPEVKRDRQKNFKMRKFI